MHKQVVAKTVFDQAKSVTERRGSADERSEVRLKPLVIIRSKWDLSIIKKGITPVFVLIYVFPHFIAMQPNGICVSEDEVFYWNAINRGRTLDAFLLAIHEDRHVFLAPLPLRGFLLRCEFLLVSCHLICCGDNAAADETRACERSQSSGLLSGIPGSCLLNIKSNSQGAMQMGRISTNCQP